jgi:hypothetical protein
MSEEVRQIKIAGAKPSDFKKRRTRKRMEGGGEEEIDPLPTLSVPKGPITISKVNDVATAPVAPAPTPAPVAPNAMPPSALAPASTEQVGGSPKVVLKPKVSRQTKVLLRKKEPVSGPVAEKTLKVKTRKVVLHALSKKLNKTRHAMKHAKELPIDQVRAVLIDKKLIKATSKAPESVLRQIYSDSLIVAKKTL